MNEKIKLKLKELPRSPGVYFHKSKSGEIIYVGKAAVLKNRVRQYFQRVEDKGIKTQALVREIADVDWVETDSEIDALFLESEMVKRYMPRYNILLRDDKSQLFVRINIKDEWPFVSFTRNPADDGAEYIGPYYSGWAVKKALRYLRKTFPYYTKSGERQSGSLLDMHIGLSPRKDMSSQEYKKSLKRLVRYITGGQKRIIRELEKQMNRAAKSQDFEQAADLRNKLRNLGELNQRIMFGDKEFLDISKDVALYDLKEMLGLKKTPVRIEGFDISHMSGTNVVASMVVFSNGASDRAEYRKFKTRQDKNDDFANMAETISRRFSSKNIKAWGSPDLVIIDGGKGQLDAALTAIESLEFDKGDLVVVGLAKKNEEIVVDFARSGVQIDKQKVQQLAGMTTATNRFVNIDLPDNSHVVKLFQRVRDESHRFAVSYHSSLKCKGQTASVLDGIPGVGPATRKKLIKHFGSTKGLIAATEEDIGELVGKTKAQTIKARLPTNNPS